MKKLIVLFVAIVSCLCSFGQTITLEEAFKKVDGFSSPSYWGGEFMSDEKDKDKAYEAPNSAMVGKWYFIPREYWRNFEKGYIQINSDGTFKKYCYDESGAYYSVTTGKWRRSKLDLTLTFNYNLSKCTLGDLSEFSLRKQDELKKECIKHQANLRKLGVKTEKRIIEILNDDVMVLNKKDGSIYLCGILVSEKYLIEKKNLPGGGINW